MKFSFLTPKEIAEMLKVAESDVLCWLEKGEMHGIKMTEIWRVREDQFDEFINAKATGLPVVEPSPASDEADDDEADYPAIRLRKPRTTKAPRRYAKLNEYFSRRHEKRAQLTFEQIEQLIERKLPESAHNHRAFWANDPKHSQAKAWMEAGWRVEAINIDEKTLYFVRKNKI